MIINTITKNKEWEFKCKCKDMIKVTNEDVKCKCGKEYKVTIVPCVEEIEE